MLALKVAALTSLPAAQVMPALLLGHSLSRALAAALIWRMEYVREEGKVKPLAQQMSTAEFAIAAITVLIAALVIAVTGWLAWPAMVAGGLLALLATLFLARKFSRRIGGYTGDCLGAVQQLSEVGFYLGLLASLQF
uniref:adenosylcobinamide-GDP ribazoletransferase n=1 Tax=Herbaspirillum autotrophicum TaxID=180195 RepID=UPI000A531B1A